MKFAFKKTIPPREPKPWAGRNDELSVMLAKSMNAWDATVFHLKNWHFKSFLGSKEYEQPLTHEFSHVLYGLALAALQVFESPSLAEKRNGFEYQGHLNGEAVITILQHRVLMPLFSDPKTFALPDVESLMQAYKDSDHDIIGAYNELSRDRYKRRFLGALYIGSKTGQTIREVEERHNFEDSPLFYAGLALAKEQGEEDEYWARSIGPIDETWTYTAKNGETQSVRPMRNPARDPDTKLILKALMPGLRYIESCVKAADRTRGVLPLTEQRIGTSIAMKTLFGEILLHLEPQVTADHQPHPEVP
jgi:hypothetical protein